MIYQELFIYGKIIFNEAEPITYYTLGIIAPDNFSPKSSQQDRRIIT